MRKLNFLIIICGLLILPAVVNAQKSCFSDFDCRFGEQCVKAPFKTRGICMQPVDDFGIKEYPTPDPDSMMPKLEGECQFNTDCPIGFYCHPYYKVCVKRR
jgi:hypothetical protein